MLPNVYSDANRRQWQEDKIEQYLTLVKRIAGRLAVSLPAHIEEDDLVGHGVFGLLDAIERFDPGRGVKFETYASLRIRGAMIDGLRLMDWVPHSARQRVKRVQEAFAELENRLGRAPGIEEVAASIQMERKEIEEILALAQVLTIMSFDEVALGDEGDQAGSYINNQVDLQAQKAFQDVDNQDRERILTEAVDRLPEKEKLVVALYYQEELTLKEIAAVMGLSESRISQLHSKAILRLRGRLSRIKKNII